MRQWLFLLLVVLCSPAWGQTASETALRVLTEQGNPLYGQNEVKLLPSAREKYADMFAAISQARHFVHIEYFIFRNDSVGTVLFDILKRKAEEGVEVRVLIDGYGNYKSPHPMRREHLDAIRQHGIQVEIFDPIRFPWITNMYHRDHRKIVVVDGLVAYTGGMNVADYYQNGTERTGEWRDMQVRLEGPVVDEFESIFAKIWERATGERLDSTAYHREPTTAGDKDIVVVNREPGKMSRKMRKAYVATIEAARHNIRIVNPYPTNTRSVSRAMKHALDRGIRMQLMVSAASDNKITPEVVAIQMKKFMNRGAEVYYYEGGFHHTKVMMVDNEFCTVGTANIDGRSFRYDYEVNAFIFSRETTRELNEIFDKDLEHSQLLTPQNFKQRFSRKQRFIGRIFQPVKNIF